MAMSNLGCLPQFLLAWPGLPCRLAGLCPLSGCVGLLVCMSGLSKLQCLWVLDVTMGSNMDLPPQLIFCLVTEGDVISFRILLVDAVYGGGIMNLAPILLLQRG